MLRSACVVENEVTTGVGNNRFDPSGSCTRSEAVTFLHRAAGTPEPTEIGSSFSDVAAGAFYDDAVRWAVEKGVTNGVGGNKFGPGITCSRGEIVTFLYRAEEI